MQKRTELTNTVFHRIVSLGRASACVVADSTMTSCLDMSAPPMTRARFLEKLFADRVGATAAIASIPVKAA